MYCISDYPYRDLCLFINLQNPKSANNQKPLPVMVWIYGGAFEGGDAGTDTYGPDYLLENDVVVVSFNYRLGLFGKQQLLSKYIRVRETIHLNEFKTI